MAEHGRSEEQLSITVHCNDKFEISCYDKRTTNNKLYLCVQVSQNIRNGLLVSHRYHQIHV